MQFVFDLDGTICFNGEPVSNSILDTLLELTKNGHEVIFASARPIRDIIPVLREDFHHYTMIGGNGSLISKQGEIMNVTSFSQETLNEITKLMEAFDATYLVDGNWDYAYTGPVDHPILQHVDPAKMAKLVTLDALYPVVKVLILTSKDNEQLAHKLSELDVYVNKHRNENVLDISPKGIHKWSALELLEMEKESYVAFGNDANDLTMFENAHHSVMIGHHEELARFAKEAIMDRENIEQKIVAKLQDLSKTYMSVKG